MTSDPTASSPDLGETHALMKTQKTMIQLRCLRLKSAKRFRVRGSAGDVLRHVFEGLTRHDRTLPADRTRVEADDAVEADLRGPPLRIPFAGPDVHPPGVPVLTHLADAAGNMILAGEHESEHPFAVAADDEGGPILALRVVLFERDPPPDDLTGVGISVEVGGVADRDRTLV